MGVIARQGVFYGGGSGGGTTQIINVYDKDTFLSTLPPWITDVALSADEKTLKFTLNDGSTKTVALPSNGQISSADIIQAIQGEYEVVTDVDIDNLF